MSLIACSTRKPLSGPMGFDSIGVAALRAAAAALWLSIVSSPWPLRITFKIKSSTCSRAFWSASIILLSISWAKVESSGITPLLLAASINSCLIPKWTYSLFLATVRSSPVVGSTVPPCFSMSSPAERLTKAISLKAWAARFAFFSGST